METANMTGPKQQPTQPQTNRSARNAVKFLVFSILGILVYFAPVAYQGSTSIPIDVIVSWISETLPSVVPVYALLLIAAGAIYPFVTKTWNESKFEIAFTVFKVLGLIAAVLIYFNWGPAWMMEAHMGTFLFYDLITFVSLIVPIGGIFLAILIGYGLLDFIGVLFQNIMRPIWKTPGRSALNALTSRATLVPVYLLTNREFKDGKYTVREAAIIVTGFITVEATFMVIIAKTLDIMNHFYLYFLVTMVITYVVTAITARIWPLSKMSEEYFEGKGAPEETIKGHYFATAWNKALDIAGSAPPLGRSIWQYFKEAVILVMAVLPAILSIGLIGLVLAEYTPVFDYIAYIFYPLTALLQVPDAMLAAKAASLGITEILLPAILVMEAGLVTKFVIGVVSVSSILFFSTTIPCILATDIPIRIRDLLVIWFERTVLSFILAVPIAFLLF